MKNNRRLLLAAFLLSLLFVLAPSAYAASDVDITVPARIDIKINADGSNQVIYPDEASWEIENNNLVELYFYDIEVTAHGGWSLVPWEAEIPADTKQLSMKLNGTALRSPENTPLDIIIDKKQTKGVTLESRSGVWNQSLSAYAFSFEYLFDLGRDMFDLTYDTGGGTLTEGESENNVFNGDQVTLPSASWPTPEYSFVGWEDSDGNIWSAGDSYTMPIGDTTLTAKWSKNKYTLTYDTRSIGDELLPVTEYYGTAIALPSTFDVANQFAGWRDESGNIHQAGSKFTITQNSKLTAVWLATIYFDTNGSPNTADSITAEVGTDITLPGCLWSDNTYALINWAGTHNSVKPRQAYTVPAGGETLIAQWDETMLKTGANINSAVPSGAKAVIFTDAIAPSGAELTDVSIQQNETIMAWLNGTTWYISTQDAGRKVYANSKSSTMFRKKSSLTSITADKLDTSNCTAMDDMFYDCSSLTDLDVSSWDVSKVVTMGRMFYNCSKLATLDLSSWKAKEIVYMHEMFSGCSVLTALDLSYWDVSKVRSLQYAFANCKKLQTLDLTGWKPTSTLTNLSNTFIYCTALTSLDLSGWNVTKVTTMNSTFKNCYELGTLTLTGWKTSSVTDLSYVFCNSPKIRVLDISGFDMTNVTTMNTWFNENRALEQVTVGKNFKLVGSNGPFQLPESKNITGADGYWYNSAGVAYSRDKIPAGVADTYYAAKRLVPQTETTAE